MRSMDAQHTRAPHVLSTLAPRGTLYPKSQFFRYRDAAGWINHPLMQAPLFAHTPAGLR